MQPTSEKTADAERYTYLVRFSGDLSTKAKTTQRRFAERLVSNIKDAGESAGLDFRVHLQRLRILVTSDSPAGEEVLGRVFGVQSVSRVHRQTWETFDEVISAGETAFADHVRGKRFAVRARRGGNTAHIPFRSRDVERELGSRLLRHGGSVDLRLPEATARLEVHPRELYLYTGQQKGARGLPLGVGGHALSLVSGGFDSAVASWILLKRGVALDYVFFNLGGAPHREGVLKVMKIISDQWSFGTSPVLYEVDFSSVVEDICANTAQRYWQVLLKQQMARAAEHLAKQIRAVALVTGESVGQVSSQTLQNVAVVARGLELPVLRPLVGYDKDDIIRLAERIGTAPLSATVPEYCALVPHKPETHAKPTVADAETARLQVPLESLVQTAQPTNLRRLATDDLFPNTWAVGEIPDGSTLLDIRPKRSFQSWHYPGALWLEWNDALRTLPVLPRDRIYVVYCEIGLKSATLVSAMREAGLTAFHVRHGARTLQTQTRAVGSS